MATEGPLILGNYLKILVFYFQKSGKNVDYIT